MTRMNGSLTDVDGIKVGHFTDPTRLTGCTVVLCENGAVCGVDVRGGAPGTRETDLLSPTATVEQIHAVLLTGGSAFGLDAASGVVRYLEERRIGFQAGTHIVPIVPAAVLFDLDVGDGRIRPTSDSGYAACLAATAGKVDEGNIGAGAGATVGKLLGIQRAMKSGLGTASISLGDTGLIVAALVSVNAVGNVHDPENGAILAGARSPDGRPCANSMDMVMSVSDSKLPAAGTNTTIGVIATNAVLSKAEATKVAQMAHDGLARTINPVHTPFDGDTIFALATSTSNSKLWVGAIGALAATAMAQAVVRAVTQASAVAGLPCHWDLNQKS